MISTYQDITKILTSQGKFRIKPGLERVGAILELLGNPQDKTAIIHVAGTNGKGSVSSILANILKCAGYKTGLYTSPHLSEYTERIKINNIDISKNDFSKYISGICALADKNHIDLTEFEILTAAAYKYFYDNKVDIALIETGLGGRFDATNVIKNPVLSIITSISLDHTDRLGNTYDEIAYEKSGIIKPNTPVITAKYNNGFNVIKSEAFKKHSKLIYEQSGIKLLFENGRNYALYNEKEYEFPLLGLYQKKNLELVLSAVNYLKETGYKIYENNIEKGLKTVKWGARLEYIPDKNIIIDGAHNPDAALELKKSLDYYFKNQKRIFIYSTLNTKDYKKISEILFNKNDEIYFFEFNHKNAVSFNEYKKIVPNIKPFNKEKLNEILDKDGLKIITGSLYMIGELYVKLCTK